MIRDWKTAMFFTSPISPATKLHADALTIYLNVALGQLHDDDLDRVRFISKLWPHIDAEKRRRWKLKE